MLDTDRRLVDKIVIVTGAAGSLGQAQVHALATEGAVVVATDVSDAKGAELVAGLREGGHAAEYRHHDVTSEEDWVRTIAHVVETHGRLDVVVNNAGGSLARRPLETRTIEDWDRLMALNVRSVFLGTKHAIEPMRRAGGGSIVNISSLAALGLATTMDACYAASKAAVTTLTKSVAAQYGADGIRCNSVHPGAIETDMSRAYYNTPERRTQRLARVPLDRFGRAAEVAEAVLFLAGDSSSYITGAELVVDGGSLIS